MAQKTKSKQLDWSSLSNNIKSAKNTTASTPAVTGNTNLASVGAAVSFTVAADCIAFIVVQVACRSTSDYEMKPCIFLDGTLYAQTDAGASLGGGTSNRAIQRSHSTVATLTAGTHTISAGIFLGSSTSPSISVGEANITAIVLGQVTA